MSTPFRLIFIRGEKSLDDLARLRLARNNGNLTRIASTKSGVSEIQPQFAFPSMLVHAMAGKALLSQNGAHLSIEVDGVGGGKAQ
jgi:hypothetical protein